MYKLPQVNEDEVVQQDFQNYLMPSAPPGSASALNFLVRVVLAGFIASGLADTGAGLSFVSSSFVKKHHLTTSKLDADECFDVRLGNGSTEPVDLILDNESLSMNSKSFKQRFHVLNLPSGLDCVLGMDFFNANDAWIHPKSKKILFLAPDQSADEAVELHTITEFKTLRRIEELEQLTDNEGIVGLSSDSNSDIEFVSDHVYTKLLSLVNKGELDWESYTNDRLRGKPRSATDKRTTAQIASERLWKSGSCNSRKHKQLVLVLHNDCWQPALTNACQYETQTITVQLLRDTRKKMTFDSSKVKPFKHGAVNRNESGTTLNFSDKAKCRCCHQHGRQMRLNHKRRYCKTCKPLINAAPEDVTEFFKPQQCSASTASAQLHSINTTGAAAADDTAATEESGEEDSVFLCQLSSEKDTIEVDDHPWFDDAADEASHGRYADLKNQMDVTFFTAITAAAVNANRETWRLFAIEAGIDESNVDDYVKQRYPIDINSIGKTVEHWQKFVDDMCSQKIERLTCFDKLERWAPLPHHPKLRLRVKKDSRPAQVHRHRVPIHLREELRKFHEDLYRRGFIEPIDDAEHLSPVVLIKKPDNHDGTSRGFRLVVNMQARNATLESIANRIPDTAEIFQRLKHAKLLSVCDLCNGYWNVSLDEQSKRLTAWGSEQSQWVWKCLPQGMVSSGPYFQTWVERLFRRHGILAGHERFADLDREFDMQQAKRKGKSADESASTDDANRTMSDSQKRQDAYAKLNPKGAALQLWEDDGFLDQYLDDSLISSKFEDETPDPSDPLKTIPGHRQHVLQFLRVCSAENLPLQAKKCHFFCKYIRHLGIVCGQGKLMCDPDKIAAAVHIQTPTTKSKLRKFLGAIGWFRMWIDSFAKLQEPLNKLLKGKEPDNKKFALGQWTEEMDKTFLELKKKLIMFPVLTNFDPALPTEIVCDASETHIGGALIQRPQGTDAEGNVHPPVVIAYHSRALIPAERKYSAQEREMLSVYSCCKKFRHYLLGAHFEVRVLNDHRSLQTVKLSKVAANRVGRWNMLLSEFSMAISYLRGEDNHLSDQLSRAVQLPEEAWTLAGPGIDTDDKFEMPFAMAWPELYRQVILMSTRQELQLMHLLHINNESHRSPQTTQTSADYCANVDKARVEAQSIRTDFDETTDEPDKLWKPHEAAIFGLTQVKFKSTATFTESQYLLCPDFGQIYERLQENDRVEKGRRRKKAHDLRMLAHDSILCPVLTRSQKQMLHEQQQDDDGLKGRKVQHKQSADEKSEEKDNKSADRKKKLPSKMLDAIIHRYHIEGGFLYFNSPTDGMVVCVPKGKAFDSDIRDYSDLTDEAAQHEKEHFTLRQTIIDELHLTPMQGHRGYNATAAAVRRRYYWPTLSADIRTRIEGCTKCNMSKIDRSKPQGKMIPVQLPSDPGQSFNLDLIVDLPEVQLNGIIYNRILVAVDRYSKRVYLNKIPKHATAPQLAQTFVDKVLLEAGNGMCHSLVSDRDTLMTSEFWQALFKRLGTTLSMSAARSQQTNGAVERIIAVVEEIFRTRIDQRQETWPDLIPHAVFAINQMARLELEGRSSLYIERGVEPALPLDLLRALKTKQSHTHSELSKAESLAADRIADLQGMRARLTVELHNAQDKQKAYYDQRRREVSALLTPGAKAWLKLDGIELDALKLKGTKRRKKLNPLYYGPYEILEQCGPNSFKLKLPQDKIASGLHPVFHVKNLKTSAPDPSYEGKFFNIPDSEIADQEYEIQKIMSHRKRYGRNEFLVHYKGFSELRGEFTEEAELRRNASDLLDEYMKRHQIVTDGYKYDDSEYESSSDDNVAADSSPPVTRKRSALTNGDTQTMQKKHKSNRGRRGKKKSQN